MLVVTKTFLQVYLVVGGYKSGGYTDTTETLLEGDTQWTLYESSLPVGMGNHAVINHYNQLYVFGGFQWTSGTGYTTMSDILLWDEQTKIWSKVGDMMEARGYHQVSEIDIDFATLTACH